MNDTVFEYVAQLYEPREGAGQVLLFVAPAGEIRAWAGVPRKAFDYQHGFQRTLNPSRIEDVAAFFKEDAKNITPTSVVVGLTGGVELEPIAGVSTSHSAVVRIKITSEDLEGVPIAELADKVLAHLRERLPLDVVKLIDSDVASAMVEAIRLEESQEVEETAADEADGLVQPERGATAKSYLGDFYARLLGYKNGLLPWPQEDQLRQVLYSFLRPGIIVDGQHRIFGAAMADEGILLSVCAVPNASWAESVYQFVVINQKARPIKPAFLSSIIATSLNNEEIKSVYSRLETSKVKVESAGVMERINTDDASPFKGMIDFQVEGALGFLQYPGMSNLVRDFKNIPRSYPILLTDATWATAEGEWLDHFFAFWRGTRAYFEGKDARLWQESTDANPSNLLKIVSLQEIQGLVLSNWADARDKQLSKPELTQQWAFNYWTDFPSTFFSDEWKKKGLQTTVGRRILRDAITETRRNIGRKAWGHRKLGLFQE